MSFRSSNNRKKGLETEDLEVEVIDPRLEDVVERLFRKCFETEDYRPAIGTAIEARRLDVVEEGIRLASERSRKAGKGKQTNDGSEKDQGIELMEYVLEIAMSVVQEYSLRNKVGFADSDERVRYVLTNNPAIATFGRSFPCTIITGLFFHFKVCYSLG